MTTQERLKELDAQILNAARALQSLFLARAKLDQTSTERFAREIANTYTIATGRQAPAAPLPAKGVPRDTPRLSRPRQRRAPRR